MHSLHKKMSHIQFFYRRTHIMLMLTARSFFKTLYESNRYRNYDNHYSFYLITCTIFLPNSKFFNDTQQRRRYSNFRSNKKNSVTIFMIIFHYYCFLIRWNKDNKNKKINVITFIHLFHCKPLHTHHNISLFFSVTYFL